MRRSRSVIALLASATVLAAGGVAGCGGSGGGASNASVVTPQQYTQQLNGSPAPLADLHRRGGDVTGSKSDLDAQIRALRGYPIVINAWAHWCEPCKAELPFFQKASLRYGTKVAFLGLNVDDSTGSARSFIAEYPLPYPNFEDPKSAVFRSLGGSAGLPTTFFLDRTGKVVFPHQGQFRNEDDLLAAIRRYSL
ncbi:MAG: redoxin protein [Conexibacter sp.]|nr:redoxin protein [Conexibacter sp.]